MQKVTLNSIKVSLNIKANLDAALRKFNEGQAVELSSADFRRLAYVLISNMVLSGEQIKVKLKRE